MSNEQVSKKEVEMKGLKEARKKDNKILEEALEKIVQDVFDNGYEDASEEYLGETKKVSVMKAMRRIAAEIAWYIEGGVIQKPVIVKEEFNL